MKKLFIACFALLFLALFSWPIGFYTFLRIVVTVSAVLIVIAEHDRGHTGIVALFAFIAILFNPVFPIYLGTKSPWTIIDIIVGALFGAYALVGPSKKSIG